MPVIKVKKSNQVTLPEQYISKLDLKEGDYLHIELKDNAIILKKASVLEEDESWFLSPEWQEKEREADRAIAEGRVSRIFDTAEEAIKALRNGTL
jgi:AbrB family looped-hinge helix DNA binding protein